MTPAAASGDWTNAGADDRFSISTRRPHFAKEAGCSHLESTTLACRSQISIAASRGTARRSGLTHESTAGVPEGVAFMVAPTGERLELLAVDPTPPGRARGQLGRGLPKRRTRSRPNSSASSAAYTPAEASPRPLRHEDVMIVAPYNLQVRCLRGRLPEAVRVGTVDKFQGQQAPVVFYSTASSSGAEIPPGLEFLLSRNRLNVAISRASASHTLSAARACSMSSAARSSRCGWLTLSVAPPRWPRGGRQA